jgi:hypothetical protein
VAGVIEGVMPCRITGLCHDIGRSVATFTANGLLSIPGSTAAIRDLVPTSDAIRDVNLVAESFSRYGIQHHIPQRWAFVRVAGDAFGTDRGPQFVTGAHVIFTSVVAGAVVGSIASIFTPWAWGPTVALIRVAYTLDSADRWYRRITTGDDDTDGVVEGTSQDYPGANFNLEVPNPASTSHTGETNTLKSYDALDDILAGRLGVLRR